MTDSNIIKLSGGKAKKEAVPLSARIAAVANAKVVKDREWREYSATLDKHRTRAEAADDVLNKARAIWQATINRKIKEDGYCEVNQICVNDKKQLVIQASCHGWINNKYPVVKIVFTFGFATDDEFDDQIKTLKGVIIASSRGK